MLDACFGSSDGDFDKAVVVVIETGRELVLSWYALISPKKMLGCLSRGLGATGSMHEATEAGDAVKVS